MSDTTVSQDPVALLAALEAFIAGPQMPKLEMLLKDKTATIEQISSLLSGDLLSAALQLTVPPEHFELPDFWPPETQGAYRKAAIAHSDRFLPLKSHPAVRFFFAASVRQTKENELEEHAFRRMHQNVFHPIASVWGHEAWIEREGKLSPICRVAFHSPDEELFFESSCDMQDLTFLARRFLQMTGDGLERCLTWAKEGKIDIPSQDDVAENIAEMEQALAVIKTHASELGIHPKLQG